LSTFMRSAASRISFSVSSGILTAKGLSVKGFTVYK
jgi:hypothetical protein